MSMFYFLKLQTQKNEGRDKLMLRFLRLAYKLNLYS